MMSHIRSQSDEIFFSLKLIYVVHGIGSLRMKPIHYHM